MTSFRLLPLALLGALAATPSPVRADTLACTEIATLPVTISSQGVYCLRKSIATDTDLTGAVRITANNVTLDCNSNQILGTGANDRGIYAPNTQNVTIRNCVVAGFNVGIQVSGPGHLVEDNTTIRSRSAGIQSFIGPSVVRRNLVVRTGGVAGALYPQGISVSEAVDVLDNTVGGVAPLAGSGHGVVGIKVANGDRAEVAGNRIWGLANDGVSKATGINVLGSPGLSIRGNEILAADGGKGISCQAPGDAIVTGNFVDGFETPISNCTNEGNHVIF